MNVRDLFGIVLHLWKVFGPDANAVSGMLWMLLALYWLISALNRKKTKRRESWAQRLLYVAPLAAAFFLLSRAEFGRGWMAEHFLPYGPATQWSGVALTATGIAIAFWARWHLGANWSGVVTLKEGHELIRTGPYRRIRHPIYTGILLGMLGTVITQDQVRGIIALGIAWMCLYLKARREELFLTEEFGAKFEAHSKSTGMFLPRWS